MQRTQLLEEFMVTHQQLIQQWKALYFGRIADENLSPALISLLFVLNQHSSLQSKHIAHKLHVTPGAVAQFLEALEQQGYIQRTTDKTDRRASYITLSKKGANKVQKLEEIRQVLFAEVAANLSDAEIATSITLNKKLLDSI